MMRLEIFGGSAKMAAAANLLDGSTGVSAVRSVDAVRAGHAVVSADLRPAAVDPMLDELRRLGVPDASISVTRLEVVDWAALTGSAGGGLVWADVIGQAWVNSRPLPRYLALMFVAGVIASYGVTDLNSILIVGAMAISPDLLPISAIGVGLVGRSLKLALAAGLTMALGLATACLAAAAFGFAQDALGLIHSGFNLSTAAHSLGSLTEVNDETIIVAFAAGAAGMLALETRASSAVGVAVSVTTIPAAAYLGVAAGLGELSEALGALAVLAMNVVMMALGASSTLWIQRHLRARALERRRAPTPGSAGID
jgi:uncharacterized hydrophobic protein (TIGR00271 family)